jgi:hypothetical protein
VHEGEQPLEAARRGLFDELGGGGGRGSVLSDVSAIRVLPESLVEWFELSDSASYPNLPTQYRLSQVDAIVDGLPPTAFSTVEDHKEHFWEWWTEEDAAAKGSIKLRRSKHAAQRAATWHRRYSI